MKERRERGDREKDIEKKRHKEKVNDNAWYLTIPDNKY